MLKPAVAPFVWRPHVEENGVTLTPDLSIHRVIFIGPDGNRNAAPSMLTSALEIPSPTAGQQLLPAFAFAGATRGTLLGFGCLTVQDNTLVHGTIARSAWRLGELPGHADLVQLSANGRALGSLNEGSGADVAHEPGTLFLAPLTPLESASAYDMVMRLRATDDQLSARFQVN